MYIVYNNNKLHIKNCKNFKDRLLGFMFQKEEINSGLLFENCNSIHTFFMKQEIDVLLVDKNNKILYIYNRLKENRIILPKKNVTKIIELPKNYSKKFKINEKIIISK